MLLLLHFAFSHVPFSSYIQSPPPFFFYLIYKDPILQKIILYCMFALVSWVIINEADKYQVDETCEHPHGAQTSLSPCLTENGSIF